MKRKTIAQVLLSITILFVGIMIGILLKNNISFFEAKNETKKEYELPMKFSENIHEFINAIDWEKVSQADSRKILTDVLDVSNIPHGDIAIPSKKVHSKRYVISQWQRSAVGSTVIIIGYDNGEPHVIMGPQRGFLRHPQGYMEIALPHEDLTGFREKNASRFNSKDSSLVRMDETIEDNAVREVYEETGLNINKEQLQLLSIYSNMKANPVCVAANYLVKLDSTLPLQTHDDEFDDDLVKPMWVKIKSIKMNDRGEYFTDLSPLSIDPKTISILKEALNKLKINHF